MDVYRIKIFLYVLLHDIDFSIDPTVEIEKKVKYVVLSYLSYSAVLKGVDSQRRHSSGSQVRTTHGQPDAVRHICDKCIRIFKHEDGTFCEFMFHDHDSLLRNYIL